MANRKGDTTVILTAETKPNGIVDRHPFYYGRYGIIVLKNAKNDVLVIASVYISQ